MKSRHAHAGLGKGVIARHSGGANSVRHIWAWACLCQRATDCGCRADTIVWQDDRPADNSLGLFQFRRTGFEDGLR